MFVVRSCENVSFRFFVESWFVHTHTFLTVDAFVQALVMLLWCMAHSVKAAAREVARRYRSAATGCEETRRDCGESVRNEGKDERGGGGVVGGCRGVVSGETGPVPLCKACRDADRPRTIELPSARLPLARRDDLGHWLDQGRVARAATNIHDYGQHPREDGGRLARGFLHDEPRGGSPFERPFHDRIPSSGSLLERPFHDRTPSSSGSLLDRSFRDRTPSSGCLLERSFRDRIPSSGGLLERSFRDRIPSSGTHDDGADLASHDKKGGRAVAADEAGTFFFQQRQPRVTKKALGIDRNEFPSGAPRDPLRGTSTETIVQGFGCTHVYHSPA